MDWFRNIALFLVLSGLLLELIADTKYDKFAQWVAGIILLLQFIQPLTQLETVWSKFTMSMQSFHYAIGTDKVLEKVYTMEQIKESSVLSNYKASILQQMEQMLKKNGLQLEQAELEVKETGELDFIKINASYLDKEEQQEIRIAPIQLERTIEKNIVSPMEIYIQTVLAEFYQIDKNRIEVVIQELN